MSDIKKDLLERAAENAFQNGDKRLASALYDQIEVKVRLLKQQVAHRPADQVELLSSLRG